jgi:acetoin:2,6-dichlorophenolindophenol oxidoreductase subunit beta
MTESVAPARIVTFREALREALFEEMEADDRVLLLGEDVGRYGGAYAVSKGLLERFGPDRVIDTPMSEAAIVGAALGAATVGGRPVAEIMYMDFVTLVMDQLVNQAAKLHYMFGGQLAAPLVVRAQQGTGRGAGSQHSQSLEAWFTHVPGLKVVAPSTPADAKQLLKLSIRDDDPVLFVEHKGLYHRKGEAGDGESVAPLGVAEVRRVGEAATLVAWSNMVHTVLDAAERLAEEGISVEVVDLRTLVPLDFETVARSVEKTSRAVVLHEAPRRLGYGAEVAAEIGERCFWSLDQPVVRIGALNTPVPTSPNLEDAMLPSTAHVIDTVRRVATS